VDAAGLADWVAAGATGFGIGSSLYRPGRDLDDLAARAVSLFAAWRACAPDIEGSAA
jgi:2-dehydro-3-deoxyphosphogalactonate aldolase